EHAATKSAIESDRTVAGVLQLAGTATAFLFSAGVADSSSVLVESGYLTASDVDVLVERGAVGDVVGRFIDASGAIVDEELDARTLGIGHEVLRGAATSVLVIAGESKHPVARAVVSSGLCSVIVTDEATALALTADTSPAEAATGQEPGALNVA